MKEGAYGTIEVNLIITEISQDVSGMKSLYYYKIQVSYTQTFNYIIFLSYYIVIKLYQSFTVW